MVEKKWERLNFQPKILFLLKLWCLFSERRWYPPPLPSLSILLLSSFEEINFPLENKINHSSTYQMNKSSGAKPYGNEHDKQLSETNWIARLEYI
jgi:hypothetical protein